MEHYVQMADGSKKELTDPEEIVYHLRIQRVAEEEKLGRTIACIHDYNNAIRIKKLDYACPRCGEDVTMAWVLLQEALVKNGENMEDDLIKYLELLCNHYSLESVVAAMQYQYYVKLAAKVSDYQYDKFCHNHDIEGGGGSDSAASYTQLEIKLSDLIDTWRDWQLPNDPSAVKVVAAAVRFPSGVVVVGARHYDRTMGLQVQFLPEDLVDQSKEVQGFIDNYSTFLTREEAFKIAHKQCQITNWAPGNGPELSSEHIY